jgi:hypothetical protein
VSSRGCVNMLSLIYFSENFRIWNEKLKSGESWGEFREFSIDRWYRRVFMRLCKDMKFNLFF